MSSTPAVKATGTNGAKGVQATSDSGYGVYGTSTSSYGVKGASTSNNGVKGTSSSNAGVYGSSTSSTGVLGSGKTGVSGTSTTGIGVYGTSTAAASQSGTVSIGVKGAGNDIGVEGLSPAGAGVIGDSSAPPSANQNGSIGVIGFGNDVAVEGVNNAASGIAVYGLASGPDSTGLYGVGTLNGVYGTSQSGTGITGISLGGTGVQGTSTAVGGISVGVQGTGNSIGTQGTSTSGTGVSGTSTSGVGVQGNNNSASKAAVVDSNENLSSVGVQGWGAVGGEGIAPAGTGGYFESGSSSITGTYALYAKSIGSVAIPTSMGIYATGSAGAAFLDGNVTVSGSLSRGGGSFLIDHPLDPANKSLYHSFVESPDMKNIYDGVVILDANGEAVVSLPAWFGALNSDFRYQLTCLGGYAPIYIASKITNNQFKIAGGRTGMEVSWQVTGIRKDLWAEKNRIPVEVEKPANQRGLYHHPELYGQPNEKGINRPSATPKQPQPPVVSKPPQIPTTAKPTRQPQEPKPARYSTQA